MTYVIVAVYTDGTSHKEYANSNEALRYAIDNWPMDQLSSLTVTTVF